MVISDKTFDILKNFSEIHQSLVFRSGNTLKTVSEQTNVLAKATISEAMPQDFAIYDLSKFLGVLSLFVQPKFTFQPKSVLIAVSYTHLTLPTILLV